MPSANSIATAPIKPAVTTLDEERQASKPAIVTEAVPVGPPVPWRSICLAFAAIIAAVAMSVTASLLEFDGILPTMPKAHATPTPTSRLVLKPVVPSHQPGVNRADDRDGSVRQPQAQAASTSESPSSSASPLASASSATPSDAPNASPTARPSSAATVPAAPTQTTPATQPQPTTASAEPTSSGQPQDPSVEPIQPDADPASDVTSAP